MAIEIELKAWVDDRTALRAKLEKFGRFVGAYQKDDEYWRPREEGSRETAGSGVRIRRTGTGPAIVTFKIKEVRDGMEVNDEREFEVSEAETFSELLTRLGLSPWIRKRKVGEAWDLDGITAELSLIEGLGVFAELEILAESDDSHTVASARKRLLDALEQLGLPKEKIESRYYTEMLDEKRKR
ncbi:MAG: class IV adenylate cyclase [Treponemataceae bacterium]